MNLRQGSKFTLANSQNASRNSVLRVENIGTRKKLRVHSIFQLILNPILVSKRLSKRQWKTGASIHPKGPKRTQKDPKGTQKDPKGPKRNPNGPKWNPKGPKWNPKGKKYTLLNIPCSVFVFDISKSLKFPCVRIKKSVCKIHMPLWQQMTLLIQTKI